MRQKMWSWTLAFACAAFIGAGTANFVPDSPEDACVGDCSGLIQLQERKVDSNVSMDWRLRRHRWRRHYEGGGASNSFALPFGYTILGPEGQMVARLLMPMALPCPSHLSIGGAQVPVRVRAEPTVGSHRVWYTDGERYQFDADEDSNPMAPLIYEDRVCEAFVSEPSGKAVFQLQDGSSVEVPVPARKPQRFLVMGDTGLRIEPSNDGWCSEKLESPRMLYGGKTCASGSLLNAYNGSLVDGLFQATHDPADPAKNGWPFQRVCEQTLKSSKPGDVVIHTGDYTRLDALGSNHFSKYLKIAMSFCSARLIKQLSRARLWLLYR